jgi:hypothetical protein
VSQTKTQSELILEYFKQGNSLTPLTALFEPFRCMRLGARCWELKKQGHNIVSKFVDLPNGKRVKSYTLAS